MQKNCVQRVQDALILRTIVSTYMAEDFMIPT